MAVSQFALPYRPAWDSNGKIIPGAKLWFTLSGTNTPTTVYANAGLTEPLVNPVIANQAGRFVPIYFNDSTALRVRLYDADDTVGVATPLEEYNPYEGVTTDLVARADIDALAAQIGANGNAPPYNAVGNGIADDTAAWAAIMASGLKVSLKAGTYLVKSGAAHTTGSGVICLNGFAEVKGVTGPGAFNIKSETAPRTGLDRNILFCNATDDLVLHNVVISTDGLNPVVMHGVRMLGGMAGEGYDLRVGFRGFSVGRMISVGSLGAGRKREMDVLFAVDSGTNAGSATFPAGAQTTVVEVDNDTLGTGSKGGNIRIRLIRDILYTGTALANFGQETDGVNIVHQGANFTSGWNIVIDESDGVGEVLDLQASYCTAVVRESRRSYNAVAKLIHGAQFNDIDVMSARETGKSVFEVAGSASVVADRDTKGNTFRLGNGSSFGSYGLGLSGETQVVLFANTTSTWKPKENTIYIDSAIGDAGLDYIVKDGGADNGLANRVFVKHASGWAIASTSAPSGNVQVTKEGRSLTKLSMSTTPSIANNTATKLPFNTVITDVEAQAVTGSNKITVKWPGPYRVRAQIRADGWTGGNNVWQLEVRAGNILKEAKKGKTNFTAGFDETFEIDAVVNILESEIGAAGADIDVWVTQDTGASRTVSNAAGFTFFEVTRL